jgi:peptidoglycan/xylan/chitin deacetylase (PgdA/CDA1 family)
MNWPNGAQCAVLLTFDFDAELMWINSYPHTPAYVSRGQYGATVGVPRILALLERFQLPATFFVPGANAERYPELVRRIHEDGHEIGHHGYLHEYPSQLEEDAERLILQKGMDALQKTIGETPRGYRSPAWDLSNQSLTLFEEFGFEYDSSMMGDDFNPYPLTAFNQASRIVEIPVAWELDDAPYFLFNFHPYRSGLSAPSHVFEIWSGEFTGAYEQGGVFTLTMHPQISGRAHRIQLLERLVRFIKGHPGVWFTTAGELAAVCRQAWDAEAAGSDG